MATTPIKCTYGNCRETFSSEKLVKEHKVNARDHHYCKRCDHDADSWETLLEHKVKEMQPYLFGIKTLTKDDKKNGIRIMHIVCEFCGEEFKAWTAREKHRLQYHQAMHDIPCKGHGTIYNAAISSMHEGNCTKVFSRPSDLISHYEKNECEFISREDFYIARQQKYIAKQIMKDTDYFSVQIKQSRAMQNGATDNDDDEWNEETGGVTLLDQENRVSSTIPIKPRVQPPNIIDADLPFEPDNLALRLQSVHINPDKFKSRPEILENLLVVKWWDSTSADYDPNLFFHSMIDAYKCPLAGCTSTFDQQVGMSEHLRKIHRLPPINCSGCSKRFDTVQALVSHCEASNRGSKCPVAKGDRYGKILDEITGGFLDVERVAGVDKLVGYTETNIRADKDEALRTGLTKQVFASKAPKTEIQW